MAQLFFCALDVIDNNLLAVSTWSNNYFECNTSRRDIWFLSHLKENGNLAYFSSCSSVSLECPLPAFCADSAPTQPLQENRWFELWLSLKSPGVKWLVVLLGSGGTFKEVAFSVKLGHQGHVLEEVIIARWAISCSAPWPSFFFLAT